MKTCRGGLGPDPKEESTLREVVDKVDCKQDLSHFQASASAAVSTSKELAERQQQALDAASQDLLCSPDIIRYMQTLSHCKYTLVIISLLSTPLTLVSDFGEHMEAPICNLLNYQGF